MSMIRKSAAAVAAAGLVVAAMPMASAQEANVRRDVTMSIPLMENHTVVFGGMSGCIAGGGDNPSHQTVKVYAADAKALPTQGLRYLILPFHEGTLKWKNLATGQEGTAHKSGNGGNLEISGVDTGHGDVEVTFTYTRSLLPLVAGSSVPGVTATHTETFTLSAYDPANCDD